MTLIAQGKRTALTRLRATLLILGLVLMGVVGVAGPASASSPGNIRPPFTIGETWYVCQGYNNAGVTHTGTSAYGLDLAGSPNCGNGASGRTVIAPISGSVYHYQAAYGNLCVNIADGRSYTLTHINSSITSGNVTAGDNVGTVAAAVSSGPPNNGGVAHIHFQLWATANCYSSSGIPFDSAHGAQICGAPDLTASGPNGGNGTWSGTSFTGQSCDGSTAVATSKPTAIQYGSEMDVFVRGGGQYWKQTWNGSSWSGFSSLGGSFAGDPAAVSYNGELSVFGVGGDGQVYKNTWNGSSWSGFSSLGGSNMTGKPSVVAYGSELDVFVRNSSNNHVYKNTWNGASWSGFNDMGGGIASDPVGVQYGSELTVFARGTDNTIYKNTWNGSSWSGFGSMGGGLQGTPHAIQYGSEFDLFALGWDNNVYKKTWNGSSWSVYNSLGGTMSGDPFGVQYSSEMDVFSKASNGQIYKTTWNGSSWSGFSSLGGNMAGDPVALSYNGELSVFAIGTNGHTYKNTWNGASWSGFNDLN